MSVTNRVIGTITRAIRTTRKKKKKKKKKKTQRSLVARFEFFSLNKHTHIYTPKN